MYGIIVVLHVFFAGIWLANLVFGFLKKPENAQGILYQFKYSKVTGIIGALGILASGIAMVLINGAYNFFQFSANHWLASKQVIMVIILILIFAVLIPTSKKMGAESSDTKEGINEVLVGKANRIGWIINGLVILNILFALSRRFIY